MVVPKGVAKLRQTVVGQIDKARHEFLHKCGVKATVSGKSHLSKQLWEIDTSLTPKQCTERC